MDSDDDPFEEQDEEMEFLYGDDGDALSETMSTGYDDEYDQELNDQAHWDSEEQHLVEPFFDSEDESEDDETCYPGDDGYDCDFIIDHNAYLDCPSVEMRALMQQH